ncbi:MAG TPA: glycosyltransferase family 4 protein [Steroidobacteraceae bacterium]|nr:glycosyltransferase family 4 protein [Steroidobacteraceae bacterium]
MKILYHHRVGSKDGQYVHIAALMGALREAGHELITVGPSAYDSLQFGEQRGWVSRLRSHLPKWLYELLEIGYSVLDFLRLSRAIRRHRPAAMYERYNLHLLSGAWAHSLLRLPLILEVNAPLAEERSRYGGLALPGLARRLEGYVWRSADYVLPVTQVLAGHVTAAGVPAQRIRVVPNGADREFLEPHDREAAKARLGLTGRTVLGFTGFVREWHRLERVLELMAQQRERSWHFHVVGDGPARPALEQLAAERGIAKQVTFTGVVERAVVPGHVASFDVALQPDVVPYASPLKLIEYLAMGRAIVAPAAANIREVLEHERNALLFDPSDDAAFAAAIERLCNDAALRARLGAEARATIDRRGLTWSANAATVGRLLIELTAAAGGAQRKVTEGA